MVKRLIRTTFLYILNLIRNPSILREPIWFRNNTIGNSIIYISDTNTNSLVPFTESIENNSLNENHSVFLREEFSKKQHTIYFKRYFLFVLLFYIQIEMMLLHIVYITHKIFSTFIFFITFNFP